MAGSIPSWLSLLSPLPDGTRPQSKPVASAEQLAAGTAGPIAGWECVTVNLSKPEHGLRHVLITLDEHGALLSGSDHVLYVLETTPDGDQATLTEHHSIGGRFETDGSFRGTHSKLTLESAADGVEEESKVRSAENRPPTDEEIAALRRLVEDVLSRR
jgi:hypothetical protein